MINKKGAFVGKKPHIAL